MRQIDQWPHLIRLFDKGAVEGSRVCRIIAQADMRLKIDHGIVDARTFEIFHIGLRRKTGQKIRMPDFNMHIQQVAAIKVFVPHIYFLLSKGCFAYRMPLLCDVFNRMRLDFSRPATQHFV
ncbi:MAG: hypothetical protein IJ354_02955 [Clostridia bacterium]|nr:hypothetical protein [Clostridia bacterium]